jgi:hypothetical protein
LTQWQTASSSSSPAGGFRRWWLFGWLLTFESRRWSLVFVAVIQTFHHAALPPRRRSLLQYASIAALRLALAPWFWAEAVWQSVLHR